MFAHQSFELFHLPGRLPSHRRILPARDIIAHLLQKQAGHRDADMEYDVHFAGSDGFQIDMTVDWDGDHQSVGTCTVLDQVGQPLTVKNLSAGSSVNDIIVPARKLRGSRLCIRMTRPRRNCGFSAWALPITWLRNPGTATARAGHAIGHPRPLPQPRRTLNGNDLYHTDVAIRGLHYVYQRHGKIAAQSLRGDGETGYQTLVLALPIGHDYELSVKLVHPTIPGRFCIQDPVTGGNSGNDDGTPPPRIS